MSPRRSEHALPSPPEDDAPPPQNSASVVARVPSWPRRAAIVFLSGFLAALLPVLLFVVWLPVPRANVYGFVLALVVTVPAALGVEIVTGARGVARFLRACFG